MRFWSQRTPPGRFYLAAKSAYLEVRLGPTGLGHHVGHGGVRVVTGVGPAALLARGLDHRASRGDRATRERGGGRTVRAALGEDIIG